jgi:hypothetical protein
MRKINSVKELKKSENIFSTINNIGDYQKDFCEYTYSRLKHKIFLEKLLHIIKITQSEFLVQISTCKSKNIFPKKIIKNVLEGLKKELDITFKDNIQNKNNMEDKINENKSILINNIFGKGKNTNNKYKKIENKKDVNNNKLVSELPHLKLLNFKIENQLRYLDIKIKLLSSNIIIFKTSPKFIYLFLDGKNDTSNAYNLLHENLISIRDKFKLIVKYKEIQNIKVEKLEKAIILLKDEYLLKKSKFHNEYINTSEIINEESKEYITKTDFCTIENYNDNNYKSKYLDENFIYKDKLIYANNNN